MARVHADLCTSKFPFNYSELSSCVVVNKGLEIQRAKNGTQEAEEQSGLPHAYYMENVVPIARGYSSVEYTSAVPAITGNPEVTECFELRGGGIGLALLAVTNSTHYLYDPDLVAWNHLIITDAYSPGTTSVANVKGLTYIFVFGVGIFLYDFELKILVQQTVLGLDTGEVVGIFAAGALLGAFDRNQRIFWSSNLNPVDFIPSLSNGAGSTQVLAIRSEIVTVETLGEDFIIYTSLNAVSGRQTGNIQYPFVFNEILGSCGLAKRSHVARNSTSGSHIVWTPNGFQELTITKAEFIWAELSDGIRRGILISLDPLMERPQYSTVDALEVKVQYCSNRYIAISLREASEALVGTPFKEAHLYDTQLGRWGRINCDHLSLFEYTIQSIEGRYTYAELDTDYATYADLDGVGLAYRDIDSSPIPASGIPGGNFGILGVAGRVDLMAPVQTANFRGGESTITHSLPRLFLGRYKVVRESGVYFTGLQANKLIAAGIRCHGHNYDGSYVRIVESFKEDLRQPGKWNQRCSADAVSIEFNSSFVLTDLSLELESSGAVNQYSAPKRKKYYRWPVTAEYAPAIVPYNFSLIDPENSVYYDGPVSYSPPINGVNTSGGVIDPIRGDLGYGMRGARNGVVSPALPAQYTGWQYGYLTNYGDIVYFIFQLPGSDGTEVFQISGTMVPRILLSSTAVYSIDPNGDLYDGHFWLWDLTAEYDFSDVNSLLSPITVTFS